MDERYRHMVVEIDYEDGGQWVAYYPCDIEAGFVCRSYIGEELSKFAKRVVEKIPPNSRLIFSDGAFLVIDLESPPGKRELLQHWAEEQMILISILISVSPFSSCATLDEIVDAIMVVESGKNENVKSGDKGRSIGPAQIQFSYWKDSKVGGSYQDVKTFSGAKNTMIAYWKRYCPKALAARDAEILSRIHNGGPRGMRISATKKYWEEVKKNLKRRNFHARRISI